MERELFDLLDAEPPSRRGLYKLIRFYNDRHEVRQDHYGSRRWLFGMADTSRHFFPRRAPGNQLGTSVADEEETFVVRRLLYANGSRVPVSCEVEDARGRYRQASIDPLLSLRGCRTFRAKSGSLILKSRVDQVLAKSLIARELSDRRALLQTALGASTARFCTKRTSTP